MAKSPNRSSPSPKKPELTDDQSTALNELCSLFSSYIYELEKQGTADTFMKKQAERYNIAVGVLRETCLQANKE